MVRLTRKLGKSVFGKRVSVIPVRVRKVLVTGDRNWQGEDVIMRELRKMKPDVVVEGGAKGADSLAKKVANKLGIEVREYPAEWDKYGRAAGPIRNQEMLGEKPDLVLAFHSNIEKSKGTKNMITLARRQGVHVKLVEG